MSDAVVIISKKIASLEATLSYNNHFQSWKVLTELANELSKKDNVLVQTQNESIEMQLSPKIASAELIVNLTEKFIIQHGKPIPFPHLYDALIASGIVIGGANPRTNLSAKLSMARNRVYFVAGKGWWLTERMDEIEHKK